MNNWFGVLNPLSKMMMVAVLVFFPVMVNVTRGLTQVEPAALELMRSYAASRVDGPRARSASRTPCHTSSRRSRSATTLSLIGAIVGEYFGGSSDVLGRVIVQSASALRFDVTWAAIILGGRDRYRRSISPIVAIERVVIPWHAIDARRRGASSGGRSAGIRGGATSDRRRFLALAATASVAVRRL